MTAGFVAPALAQWWQDQSAGSFNGGLALWCLAGDPRERMGRRECLLDLATRCQAQSVRNDAEKLLGALHARSESRAAELKERGYTVLRADVTSTWRVAIGTGMLHPAEAAISVDRVSGAPILPGSSLKGAARAALRRVMEDDENLAPCEDWLFGQPAGRTDPDGSGSFVPGGYGAAVFFDALPVAWPTIEVDVITPIWGEYYASGDPAQLAKTPEASPNFFLCVGSGAGFSVIVAVRPPAARGEDSIAVAKKRVLRLKDAITDALSSEGIGGRTAAGFGYFTLRWLS